MGKLEELQTTSALVKDVLEKYPNTRNSDNELYYWVCVMAGKQIGIDVHRITVAMFLLHLNEYGFPQFETVRRTRQKLQATYPELSAASEVEAQRNLNEKAFRDYARGGV